MRFLAACLGVAVLVLAHPAGAGVVTIVAARDNTLFQDAQGDTSSGAGPAFFAGVNGQGLVHRGLLAFDLAGQVPAGALVDSIVLTVEVTSAPDTITRAFALHRVLADWGEGTSSSAGGSGAPATPGDATWLHTFYPDRFWLAAGGDFDPATSATTPIGDVGTYAWRGPGLAADVQAWLLQPASNFGWLVQGDEARRRTVRRFDSRETGTPGNAPTLTIHYSTAADPVFSTTWGRLKARYR